MPRLCATLLLLITISDLLYSSQVTKMYDILNEESHEFTLFDFSLPFA